MDRREQNHKWYSRFDEKAMVFIIENGEGEEIEIPAEFEVCGTCEGRGKHVNPSIDSHGISADEFYEDPDFAEDYFSGTYDVPCNECHGARVSPVIAEDCPSDLRKLAEEWMQDHFEMEAMYAAERRMGA